jgi:hypothetical protein
MRPGWFYSSEFLLESCRLVADERRLAGFLAQTDRVAASG